MPSISQQSIKSLLLKHIMPSILNHLRRFQADWNSEYELTFVTQLEVTAPTTEQGCISVSHIIHFADGTWHWRQVSSLSTPQSLLQTSVNSRLYQSLSRAIFTYSYLGHLGASVSTHCICRYHSPCQIPFKHTGYPPWYKWSPAETLGGTRAWAAQTFDRRQDKRGVVTEDVGGDQCAPFNLDYQRQCICAAWRIGVGGNDSWTGAGMGS